MRSLVTDRLSTAGRTEAVAGTDSPSAPAAPASAAASTSLGITFDRFAGQVVQHVVDGAPEHLVGDTTLALRAEHDDLGAAGDGFFDDRPPRPSAP